MTSRRFTLVACALAFVAVVLPAATTILNVSYDVTREFYKDYNRAFAAHWRAAGHGEITINQSHGGSSKQTRSVIDGLGGDVVTMNQALDIDQLAKAGFVPPDWAKRLPHDSVPYTSTISFSCGKEIRRASRTGRTSCAAMSR